MDKTDYFLFLSSILFIILQTTHQAHGLIGSNTDNEKEFSCHTRSFRDQSAFLALNLRNNLTHFVNYVLESIRYIGTNAANVLWHPQVEDEKTLSQRCYDGVVWLRCKVSGYFDDGATPSRGFLDNIIFNTKSLFAKDSAEREYSSSLKKWSYWFSQLLVRNVPIQDPPSRLQRFYFQVHELVRRAREVGCYLCDVAVARTYTLTVNILTALKNVRDFVARLHHINNSSVFQLIIGLTFLPVLFHILMLKFQVVCQQDKVKAAECKKTVKVFIDEEENPEIRNLLKLSNDLDITAGQPEVIEETLDSRVNDGGSQELEFQINSSSSSDGVYQDTQTIQSDNQVSELVSPDQIRDFEHFEPQNNKIQKVLKTAMTENGEMNYESL
ncbi:uncharacterized protein LOC143238582 isoform X2 [Tachypleus tridentatus]|uniref:uncharacterized protein LOC143238582 isoform X2 n=1 Tax=Tachypleus tridentatus TaxID=6853 RepID=UPI003FD4E32B